jgi:hypothetical protein
MNVMLIVIAAASHIEDENDRTHSDTLKILILQLLQV